MLMLQPMSVSDVSNLSIQDKLQLMENLWLDMRGRVEAASVSPAHRTLLDTRRARVESGASKLHDGEDVKHSIGRR
jgi:hypothetical protein